MTMVGLILCETELCIFSRTVDTADDVQLFYKVNF